MSDLTALMERVESIDGNVSEIVRYMSSSHTSSVPSVTMDFSKTGDATDYHGNTQESSFASNYSINILEDLSRQFVVTDPLRIQAERFGSDLGTVVFEGFKTTFNVEEISKLITDKSSNIPFNSTYGDGQSRVNQNEDMDKQIDTLLSLTGGAIGLLLGNPGAASLLMEVLPKLKDLLVYANELESQANSKRTSQNLSLSMFPEGGCKIECVKSHSEKTRRER